MSLTDVQIKNLPTKLKNYKKYDGDGLYVEVSKKGSKLWRFRYKFEGKNKLLALGKYPTISLKDARNFKDKAKQDLYQGIDPAHKKKELKQSQINQKNISENTFEKLALEWWHTQKNKWTEDYANNVWRRLEINVLPWIGKMPIAEIDPPLLLKQIRRIEGRGVIETAKRTLQIVSSVFRYGIACGKVTRDPASDIRDALTKTSVKHHPAFTEPEDIKILLRAIDNYQGSLIVRCATKLSALFFLRPGELRKGTWDEIDFSENIWKIPAERMKMKKDHLVPLARQSLKILEELKPLTYGCKGNYIFPGERMNGRPISENTVSTALRNMGISREKMCPHGFRTMASTRLHESGLFDSRAIEIQLAHVDKNTIRGIYNRALYLEERRKMMQWWADYLESLREGAKIMALQQKIA